MKKTLIIVGIFFSLIMSLVSFSDVSILQGNVFLDVPSAHQNSEAINFVKSSGIVQGYDDGTFKPDQKINRAEFTKIIMGENKSDWGGSLNCFPDVTSKDWFAPFVCAAKDQGIIDGYPDGTFKPGNNISFVEAAKIMASIDPNFQLAAGEPWYMPYVEYLGRIGAIPFSIDKFTKEITRGEVVEILYRLISKITSKDSLTYESLKYLDSLYNGQYLDDVIVSIRNNYLEKLKKTNITNEDYGIQSDNQTQDDESSDILTNENLVTSPFLGQSVPCESKSDVKFTSKLIDFENIWGVTIPGSIDYSTVPLENSDIIIQNTGKVPVYVPVDSILVKSQVDSHPTDDTLLYTLSFHAGCQLLYKVGLLSELASNISTKVSARTGESSLSINVKAGDLIGYFKASNTIERVIFSLHDSRLANTFVNSDRYKLTRPYLYYSVCPFDYFEESLKDQFYSKFTETGYSLIMNACPSISSDVDGTLSGTWWADMYVSGSRNLSTEALTVAMNRAYNAVVIKIGTVDSGPNDSYEIYVAEETFVDPAEITDQHCYYDTNKGKAIYFKLVSSNEMQVVQDDSGAQCRSTMPTADVKKYYR